MKLKDLELRRLEIPFCVSFNHSQAQRSSTETVIAIAHCDNGIKGYGEGCPRQYVTSESIETCLKFLKNNKSTILQINDINSLQKFVFDNKLIIDQNPSAWCAIEIAILDLIGKIENKSIEKIIGIPEILGDFQYTAVLGISNTKIFQTQLKQYINLGFCDFKVKISGNLDTDKLNLKSIYDVVPNARIRLDANNLWNDSATALYYLKSLQAKFWAIEEPIKTGDFVGLKNLSEQLNCKIILDESFLTLEQVKYIHDNEIWIPNIRISKMGGLLRSLIIAKECKKHKIKFIIGAQVGETSILSRVAISLANAYPECLITQEGAYGTYLLKYDVTNNPIMFGNKGLLSINKENGKGLGLSWALN